MKSYNVKENNISSAVGEIRINKVCTMMIIPLFLANNIDYSTPDLHIPYSL